MFENDKSKGTDSLTLSTMAALGTGRSAADQSSVHSVKRGVDWGQNGYCSTDPRELERVQPSLKSETEARVSSLPILTT